MLGFATEVTKVEATKVKSKQEIKAAAKATAKA